VKRDRVWLWVGGALLALVLVGGGAVVVVSRERLRDLLRRAAIRYGIRPELVDALAKVESNWKLGAVNKAGRDGARGGAFGPTQITEQTLRSHGGTFPAEQLTQDPELAAEWTARIIAARPGGPPTTPEDLAAWWNAGRSSWAALPLTVTRKRADGSSYSEPHPTRADYLPKLVDALDELA
jgi:soluble lytic murein transglycosylase-like protein